MSIALIIVGFMLWQFGARIHFAANSQSGGQNLISGFACLIMQLIGIGMIFWGVASFFM